MNEPDAEKKAQFEGFKAIVEAKANATYATFVAVKYTQQVVAGMIYQVKYQVGDAEFVHAKVVVPLPHTGNPPEVMAFVGGQTADAEFAF
eukprot:CAMPEP_0194387372 /NCGR_PEP_ID=MMETSP0174-20130528/91965_1 /TAXON_ID=216777 /ORGANISM="Proboscia alata, Strain PI-D3" /LENGTH=89 /DNA_ID=CAMNT_0039177491 /DNA_START=12 /DNA_END=281 /DNA_ORIENTATION=+